MAWLLDFLTAKPSQHTQDDAYREAIRESAKVGGKLFGPVPDGVRREFFCLDSRTWVWHEEWTGADGKIRFCTTRYDMRPNGIIKAQDGQPYSRIGEEEAERLLYAIRTYNETIDRELAPYLQPAAV
jgi:hypothetical protein